MKKNNKEKVAQNASKKVYLKISLSSEDYEKLKIIAKSNGYNLVSHYLYSIIQDIIRGKVSTSPVSGISRSDLEMISKRIERVIQDLLNPYTGKLDEIGRRLGEIYELLESLTSQTGAVKGRFVEEKQKIEQTQYPRQRYAGYREYREQRPQQRMTAFQRLKEQKILFESASWIRRPDKLFQSLEREGAIVIRFTDGRVAVDPDFWREFKEKLSEIAVRTVDEVELLLRSSLGDEAGELFRKLVREGLAYYDEDEKSWIVSV